MKFGVCCGLEEVELVLGLGFDYVELGASALTAAPNLDAYRGLPVEVTNLFFPGSIQLFGEGKDAWPEYGQKAISRAAELGVKVMVIGSGASRRAPEAVASDASEARFVGVVQALQEVADRYGVRLAPESLNRTETNVGNDCGELAHRLRAVGVGYTADLYHLLFEAEADQTEVDWAAQVPFTPTHVHLADLQRFAPTAEDPHVVAFAHRLKALGYNGRISLECSRPQPAEDLRRGLETLRARFDF